MVVDAFTESCRQTASKVLQRYNWTLLSKDELTQQLVERVQPGMQTGDGIERAARTLCSVALYHACHHSDPTVHGKAFTDLSNYLYDFAYRAQGYDPETAADLTQSSLEEIWQRKADCQAPETFLRFCIYCLLHARTNYQRQQNRNPMDESLSISEREDGGENLASAKADPNTQMPEEIALCTELYERLAHSFGRVQKSRKRAERQFEVLYQSHVVGLSDQEIAEQLQVTVEQVYVWKSRGRKILCGDAEFVALLSEVMTNCKAIGKFELSI
jgi:RNA polymerase sigma factor (sigma-70 family)